MDSRLPSSKDPVFNHIAVIEAPQCRINLGLQQSFLKNMYFGLRMQFGGSVLAERAQCPESELQHCGKKRGGEERDGDEFNANQTTSKLDSSVEFTGALH